MRVSEHMKTSSLLIDLNRTMERMMKAQDDITSTKRIHRPSDDPSGTSRLLHLKTYLSRNERFQKNVEDGSHWAMATESTLNDVLDVVIEIDNILMQASNDTLSENEREVLAGQMQQMLEQVVDLANHEFGDKYLFGGTENDTPPFTLSNAVQDESFTSDHDVPVVLDNVGLSSGSVTVETVDGLTQFVEGSDFTIDYEDGTITVLSSGSMADSTDYLISYQTENMSTAILNPNGVDGSILRKIDEGVTLQINVSASDLFSGTDGIINSVRRAIAALERNDMDEIKAVRGQLDANLNTLTGIQGEVGAKVAMLEVQLEKLELDQLNLERLISNIEDTDVAKTVVEFQKDQIAYQAALRVGSDLIQSTLLDFLR